MDKEKPETNEFENAEFEEWRESRFTRKIEAQLREEAAAEKRALFNVALRSSDASVARAAVLLGTTEHVLCMLRGEDV